MDPAEDRDDGRKDDKEGERAATILGGDKQAESEPAAGLAGRAPRWLARRLPLLAWLPRYHAGLAVADLVAGITLGLTMMPQSIAYAQLAGVSPEFGLYSSICGGFVYMFLGTIKQVIVGPASITSIITLQFTRDRGVRSVHLLTFYAGLAQLAMAVFRLGFLVDFISGPVVSAFTSATAIIIMVAQLRPLLGLAFRAHGCLETLVKVAEHISEVRPADALLGFASMAFLWSFKALALVRADPKRPAGRALWFLSISKNALCITSTTMIASVLHARLQGGVPFKVVGAMPPGLPAPMLPPFGGTVFENKTYSFAEMTADLGVGVVVAPVVGVLVNVAIGKAYAGADGAADSLDASQEILALSACNLVGSLVQAMPVAGALTRSAVAEASNVRTPLAGLYCSLLIMAGLAFLTPYFFFIPRATLAAVLIVAVGRLVDYAIVPRLWRSSKRDLAVLVSTFATCLWLGVEAGLVLGMALDATRLLQPWAAPAVAVSVETGRRGAAFVLVRPSLGLLYPGVDALRQRASLAARLHRARFLPVVIDCDRVVSLDFTAAAAVVALAAELGARGQRLLLAGAAPAARASLLGAGLDPAALCDLAAEALDLDDALGPPAPTDAPPSEASRLLHGDGGDVDEDSQGGRGGPQPPASSRGEPSAARLESERSFQGAAWKPPLEPKPEV